MRFHIVCSAILILKPLLIDTGLRERKREIIYFYNYVKNVKLLVSISGKIFETDNFASDDLDATQVICKIARIYIFFKFFSASHSRCCIHSNHVTTHHFYTPSDKYASTREHTHPLIIFCTRKIFFAFPQFRWNEFSYFSRTLYVRDLALTYRIVSYMSWYHPSSFVGFAMVFVYFSH